MTTLKKGALIIVSLALVVFLASAFTATFSRKWCFIFSILFYAVFTFFILKKYGYELKNVFFIAAPWIILGGYIRIKDFHQTLISLPNFIAVPIGISVGTILFRSSSLIVKFICAFSCVSLMGWYYFAGQDYWDNKWRFDTYTGLVNEPAPLLNFKDFKGNIFNASSSIIVLDFWHTRCGYCFEQFPELENFYKQYENNPSVKIIAANLPIDTDSSNQSFAIIKSLGYDFMVLKSADTYDATKKEFNFSGVPATIIIDKNSKIRYRGNLREAEKALNRLLNE